MKRSIFLMALLAFTAIFPFFITAGGELFFGQGLLSIWAILCMFLIAILLFFEIVTVKQAQFPDTPRAGLVTYCIAVFILVTLNGVFFYLHGLFPEICSGEKCLPQVVEGIIGNGVFFVAMIIVPIFVLSHWGFRRAALMKSAKPVEKV